MLCSQKQMCVLESVCVCVCKPSNLIKTPFSEGRISFKPEYNCHWVTY